MNPARPRPFRAALTATVSAYPSQSGVYFGFKPLRAAGVQSEGGASSLSAQAPTDYLLLLPGSTVPISGADLAAEWTGTRWVAEAFGVPPGGGQFIAGCPCTLVPTPLTMAVSKPNSNYHIFHDCTITWQSPVPSRFSSLALGTGAFLSTASFTDDISTNPFWYYFTCNQGYYALTRVYARTSDGPSFQDSIRYKWLAGFGGNTCSPFSLTNGSIFSGGDATCVVSVTG